MYAIILAGGQGTRLRPLTFTKPKPMVEVLGKPILGYQIEHYRSHGITNLIIASGYLSHVIEEYFGDGSRWGVQLKHLNLGEEMDTSERVYRAMQLVPETETEVFLSAGDIIVDLNLTKMLKQHRTYGGFGTINVSKISIPFGVIAIDEHDNISQFTEKPELYINNSFGVIRRDCLSKIIPVGTIFGDGFRNLHSQMYVYFDPLVLFLHISTPSDITAAEEALRKRYAPKEFISSSTIGKFM